MAYNKLHTWHVDVNADSTVAETTFSAPAHDFPL